MSPDSPLHTPPPARKPKKTPLSRAERLRKIKAIQAQIEAKKRELGMKAPSFNRGPVFYLGLVAVLAILGLSVIKASEQGGGDTSVRVRNGKVLQTMKSVDAFAEALGRFKFHCGTYPTAEEGLEALALRQSRYEGWIGPYISKMLPDPWKRPYVYEPTNEPPVLLSLGPDGVRGTPDDIRPDPALFTKPFRDTTWTNDWAPYQLRGYIVVPHKTKR